MSNEVWKDIKGYDGTFQISSLGNVKRVKSPSGKYLVCKLLKVCKHKNGYSGISLWKNGVRTRCRINRLVAETFIEKSDDNKKIVHHKNYNRSDNRVENLEWVTHLYNLQNKMPKYVKKKKLLMDLLKILNEMGLLKENIDETEILKKIERSCRF
jgi:hypothetical protein